MKKLISLLLVLATVSSLLLALPISVSAESLYIRKIVSVVYDDSGSMKGDKRAYASYAMQAFCGMLNSEDRLFLTYMSSPKTAKEIDLSAKKIQDSVDAIRNFKYNDNTPTPFDAVETAYAKLKGVDDPNVNTQYWLVVITDGDFNECQLMTANTDRELEEKKKAYLNDHLGQFMGEKMPNGTSPQLTFLGIGDVASPDEDEKKGIYTYSTSDASGIINAMSEMADRISGRTRLKSGDIKQSDDKTIQVYSSIPLLNIAVLAQESKAKIVKAEYGNEINIPISRQAYLEEPGYSDLVGGAFLLGDSQKAIGVGEYEITFDQKIDPDKVVVLFEPALEVRTVIEVNGKKITDLKDLNKLQAGDQLSLSGKIYEMGTDKEIDPSLLPPGTKFSAKISANGKVEVQSDDTDLAIKDYELKEGECDLKVSVQIDGFNPIEFAKKFNVQPPAPSPYDHHFTVFAAFGSDTESVKYEKIGKNKDLTVEFTVTRDGKEMTDPEEVKKLAPKIKFSPDGNGGSVVYAKDGRIVVTPNKAGNPVPNKLEQDVEVECIIEDENGEVKASDSISYTVTYPNYGVVAVAAAQPIKKTRLYNNKTSVSFYVMKDGAQLSGDEVEDRFTVSLNKEHEKLKTDVSVSPDGLITVTPYSQEKYGKSWFVDWWYYFGLSEDDIVVNLDHELGKASASIDVEKEPFIWYELLCVYLPLCLEAALVLFLIWWIVSIFLKPKFLPGAVLYLANLSYGGGPGRHYHEIGAITEVNLRQYNALKYRLNPFTLKGKKHFVGNGLTISADYGGSIKCHNEIWYKGEIVPVSRIFDDLGHPQNVKEYIDDHDSLRVRVISVYDADAVHAEEEVIENPNPELYYVHTDMGRLAEVAGLNVIEDGTIFAYAIRLNN